MDDSGNSSLNTLTDPIDVYYKDIGTINGRSVNLYLHVNEITYGSRGNVTSQEGSTEVMRVSSAFTEFGDYSGAYEIQRCVKFTVRITYADGDQEEVDLPFYEAHVDLDQPYDGGYTTYYSEDWAGENSSYSAYYVWPECKLTVEQEGSATRFISSHSRIDNDSDETFTEAGVVSLTNTGNFTEYIYGAYNANRLYIYSDYLNIEEPVKSVTSTGSNTDQSYAPEDTVSFAVEQKMGSKYVDTFDPYTSLTFTDTIPDGLTYVSDSAAMYDADEDITSTAGAVSYDSSTNTLTYTFSADWLNAFDDNYNGQTLKMTFDCTVDATVETPTTIENAAYTTFSGLVYDSNTVEIPVNAPALAIVKNVDGEQYYVGDEVTYTIDVTQTVEDLTAENVVITDTLPDEVELADVVLDGVSGTVSIDGNSFEATCPTLAYGETASLIVTATAVTAGTGVVNTAYADADNTDPVDDDATVDILAPEGTEPGPVIQDGGNGTTGTGTSGPKTSDTNTLCLYIILIMIAGAAIVVLCVFRRTARR